MKNHAALASVVGSCDDRLGVEADKFDEVGNSVCPMRNLKELVDVKCEVAVGRIEEIHFPLTV